MWWIRFWKTLSFTTEIFNPAVLPSLARAENGGYLLLRIEKYSYSNNRDPQVKTPPTDVVQTYKVLIDDSFISQFKKLPSKTSMGTEFYCNMSDGSIFQGPAVMFSQWFNPFTQGKIKIRFWAEGAESLGGKNVLAMNPKAQTSIGFPDWQSIDSSQMLSFTGGSTTTMDGINLSFGIKSVSADDPALASALLAPLSGADGSSLVKGDGPSQTPLTATCKFQDN